jgi:predicted XRE-type DNA-binding protein
MKKSCEICCKLFYSYRKVLKFCSRQCSAKWRAKNSERSYLERVKMRIKKNSSVDPVTGCWNWKMYKDNLGRGNLWFRGTTILASRASFISFNSEIHDNLLVCHSCDNYSCVNPSHLFLGTNKDNCDDRERKNRGAKGEKIKNSKLKNYMIKEIIELRKNGLSQREIGEKYNVSQTCISRIISGKCWGHI